MTTHQLQQQKRNKCTHPVQSPRKSAQLNNVEVVVPFVVKSSQKPALPKVTRESRDVWAEVTSVGKSSRLKPQKGNIFLQQKQESIAEKNAQKSGLLQNPKKGGDANDIPKSASVRRKMDLHNSCDEDENIDATENIDENEVMSKYL